MTRARILLLILVLIVVLSLLITTALSKDPSDSLKLQEPSTQPVTTATADETPWSEPFSLFGVTRGASTALVSFTLGGRLEKRPLEIGDPVTKSAVIAQIDTKPFQNKLKAIRGSLDEVEENIRQLERDVKRSQNLFEQGAATREEVEKTGSAKDALISRQEALKAEELELRRMLDEAQLRAPINGAVTEVFLEPGEFAAPGQPIYAISGKDLIEVELEVPESVIANLKPGTQVTIDFPHLNQTDLPGSVSSVGESTLGPGRLFPVLINITPFEGLLPGMTATVHIQRELHTGISVPIEALFNPGGQESWIYKIVQNKAFKTSVSVERLRDDRVLITGDVQHGDQIITGGHFALAHGDPVIVTAGETAQ